MMPDEKSMAPCTMSGFSTFAYFAYGGMLRIDAFEMSRRFNVKLESSLSFLNSVAPVAHASVRIYNIEIRTQSARNAKWHIIAIMCVKCKIHENPKSK